MPGPYETSQIINAAPTSPHATATMRANRGKDTRPELLLRRELHRRGARYRTNLRIDLAEGRRVRPDVVFTAARVAVFVDGCFWHGCRQHRTLPARNADFWREKIEATRRRDDRNDEWLVSEGWRVVRLWEHVPPADAAEVVLRAVAEARTAAAATTNVSAKAATDERPTRS